MSLTAAGVGPEQERVYRILVETGESTAAVTAERLGLPTPEVERILGDLLAQGLVTAAGEPPHYAARPPDVAFAPLLRRGTEALDLAREAVAQLDDAHRAASRRHDADQLVEIVTGSEAIRHQLRMLQLSTTTEILWFCRAGHVAMPSSDNDEEIAMLERGVSYRVIYERALLEEDGMVDDVARGVRAGELARAHPELPVRMAVADRKVALCPLVSDRGRGEPTAALVRESNLLTALLALFDSYWQAASPLHVADVPTAGPVAPEERELLSLLVAGVSDKAIATRLGVSNRTVQRRISDLMERTGAQTRMQLAWQVAGLGWLERVEHPLH